MQNWLVVINSLHVSSLRTFHNKRHKNRLLASCSSNQRVGQDDKNSKWHLNPTTIDKQELVLSDVGWFWLADRIPYFTSSMCWAKAIPPSKPSQKDVYIAAKSDGVGYTFSKREARPVDSYFKIRQSKTSLDAMPPSNAFSPPKNAWIASSPAFEDLIQKRSVWYPSCSSSTKHHLSTVQYVNTREYASHTPCSTCVPRVICPI